MDGLRRDVIGLSQWFQRKRRLASRPEDEAPAGGRYCRLSRSEARVIVGPGGHRVEPAIRDASQDIKAPVTFRRLKHPPRSGTAVVPPGHCLGR